MFILFVENREKTIIFAQKINILMQQYKQLA